MNVRDVSSRLIEVNKCIECTMCTKCTHEADRFVAICVNCIMLVTGIKQYGVLSASSLLRNTQLSHSIATGNLEQSFLIAPERDCNCEMRGKW